MNKKKSAIMVLGLLGITVFILYGIHLLQTGEAKHIIEFVRNWGFPGVCAAIILQSLINMLPVPGEFTAIILLDIYGPVLGGVYNWISGLLGAVAGYYLTWWIAKPLLGKKINPYLQKMEGWLRQHERKGLLLIRFVPLIPYHFVNYAAGMLKVNLISFVWTTGIAILPHTVAMSLLFAGVQKGSLTLGVIGCITFLLLGGFAWYVKKRSSKSALEANKCTNGTPL
ncbi:VTT domain-containing protein [Paenibacillus sp. KQZ6P-2]|uniref:TVP38/TMEM64 family membrane protein n=1 Tax=Paenibacillus mangrovi TaxID=2931978 RepID=A0A9X1WTU8_9BACL|nr:VTT domain-containing protein [Paenibacillus mangrovi]MCJ8013483.1 VTT domain-containing protein [Paenibacillus mangrovi]